MYAKAKLFMQYIPSHKYPPLLMNAKLHSRTLWKSCLP